MTVKEGVEFNTNGMVGCASGLKKKKKITCDTQNRGLCCHQTKERSSPSATGMFKEKAELSSLAISMFADSSPEIPKAYYRPRDTEPKPEVGVQGA